MSSAHDAILCTPSFAATPLLNLMCTRSVHLLSCLVSSRRRIIYLIMSSALPSEEGLDFFTTAGYLIVVICKSGVKV